MNESQDRMVFCSFGFFRGLSTTVERYPAPQGLALNFEFVL